MTQTPALTASQNNFVPRGSIAGLTLSATGSSATFGIAAGQAADSTGVALMNLLSAYTKTTSAWALGTAAGALDTGSIANSTWYHVYLIQRPDTLVTDIIISLSATAPTLPTNYTLKRRIGSMKTNGSAQWLKFIQVGDLFTWDVIAASDLSNVNPGTTPTLYALSVPTGVVVLANIIGLFTSSTGVNRAAVLYSPSVSAQSAAVPAGNAPLINSVVSVYASGTLSVLTNTSAQVYAVTDQASGGSLYAVTPSWTDFRGRND